MKRGTGLRSDPAKQRAWAERSRAKAAKNAQAKARKKIKATKAPARKTKLKPINRKRIKKLRMEQGLDGPKAEWIRTLPSCVTGRWGWEGDPMTVSHVLGTRATGAGPEGTVPMLATENTDWDSLDEAKWLDKYGISKPFVRELAVELNATWNRVIAELEA